MHANTPKLLFQSKSTKIGDTSLLSFQEPWTYTHKICTKWPEATLNRRCITKFKMFGLWTEIHRLHWSLPIEIPQNPKILNLWHGGWLERISILDFDIIPIKIKSSQVADGLSWQKFTTNRAIECPKELFSTLIRNTSFMSAISTPIPGLPLNTIYWTTEKDKNMKFESLYYCRNMQSTVVQFIARYQNCLKPKALNYKPCGFFATSWTPRIQTGSNYHTLLCPLPGTTNGNSTILNIVCKLSKVIRIIPIKSKSGAPKVARKFKDHIYRSNGLLSKIISDRESLFMSKFWKALFKLLNTKLALSTAYKFQTDCQSETTNPKIEEMIRFFPNYKRDNWDDNFLSFEVAYNSAVNRTTLRSAFYVNHTI